MTTTNALTFNNATALAKLWRRAEGQMTAEDLQWFATGAESEAANQTKNLSAIAKQIGCTVIFNDESPFFQDRTSVSELLFFISSQLETIHGLSAIAAHANERLRGPDFYARISSPKRAKV